MRRRPNTTHDALIVVPGVMGSELEDSVTGEVLWGLDPKTMISAWTVGSNLHRLRLSSEEREGRYGRITATRLLRVPAWLPFLQGIEPYTDLLAALRTAVADPAVVREFPYDWRLSVAHNAARLAECAMAHLDWWRQQPAHQQARRDHPTGRPAKLVFVAHSMGGLLVRHLALIPGVSEQIRACVTLGTPFHGAVKAAILLSTGKGTALPARRPLWKVIDRDADHGVRSLARTLPGIYDLLPSYRCVRDGEFARPLTAAEVIALGGDAELATTSEKLRRQWRDLALPGHELLVGKAQPTMQNLTITDGVAIGHPNELRLDATGAWRERDRMGDGTVPTSAAELAGTRPERLAQQHGALARASDAIERTLDIVRELDLDLLGPPLTGEDGIGLDLPDTPIPAGQEWPAIIMGLAHPRQATCTLSDVVSGRQLAKPRITVRDNGAQARLELPRPGLYRVTVAGSGASPVTQLVLAAG